MARYLLVPWRNIAAAGEDPHYTPDIDAAAWDVLLDCRPRGDEVSGWALIWVDSPTRIPSSAIDMGDDVTPVPNRIKNLLRSQLGIATLAASTVPNLLRELLTVHAREDGTRWRPMTPRVKSTAFGTVREFRIPLGRDRAPMVWEESA